MASQATLRHSSSTASGQVVHHTIGPEDWDSEAVYQVLLQLLRQNPDSTQATRAQQQTGS